jgi:hypothetical protein
MNNILTAAEAQSFKDIGQKIDIKKIDSNIEQAQLTELKGVLGDRFYFDLLNNVSNPTYQDLLSGSSFTYLGVNYYQDGLKALLADYFMAKYVLSINNNFTPFGATQKAPQDGELTDRNSLKDISTQQMQLAGARWEIIKMYLNVNYTLFPHWLNAIYGDESQSITGKNSFRFRKI